MITSTFDIDAEGWTTTNTSLFFDAAGGNAGGAIRGNEGGSGVWGFLAPTEYLGDLSSYMYGTLSFELRQVITTSQVEAADVTLIGGGLTLALDIGPNPGTDWTSYEVTFGLGSGWRLGGISGRIATEAEILQVLTDVTQLRIRGEFVSGTTNDIAYLDNVVIAEGVPPPGDSADRRVESTFDTNVDGWSFIADVSQFRQVSSGGNPGGYLEAVDATSGVIWYFAAAPKFLGDKSDFYGGTLSYDLKQSGPGAIESPDVRITGGGVTLVLNRVPPGVDWTSYELTLDTRTDWRINTETGAVATEAQIRAALADITSLHIRGEYIGGADTGGLDNVVMLAPDNVRTFTDATLTTEIAAFTTLADAIASAAAGDGVQVVNTAIAPSGAPIVVNANNLTVFADAPYVDQLALGTARVLSLGGTASFAVTGSTAADTINGGSGSDTLIGGGGSDRLAGGAGDDTYVEASGDTLVELSGGGIDTVQSTVTFSLSGVQHVENIALKGSANANAIGNGLANVITGNIANNRINGGAGNDTMAGGLGDDTYIDPTSGDVITELAGGGTDTVESSATFSLAALVQVENLTLTGAAGINAGGNALNNVLTGNTGNNILNGNAGADTMAGGIGNDIYYVDTAGDVTTELFNQGTDLVSSSVSRTLSANIENLNLSGAANIDGNGNTGGNVINGNAGNNILRGYEGGDTLNGGGGNDILLGGTSSDALNPGSDAVRDIIRFSAVGDSTGSQRDIVTGMDLNGEDVFDFTVVPTSIGVTVTSGALNLATINADLAAAVNANLNPNAAVLFDPSSGDLNLAGHVFLVVDANGDGSYTAGQDYVVQMVNTAGAFSLDDFT